MKMDSKRDSKTLNTTVTQAERLMGAQGLLILPF
jgi:hypothetical protein